MSKNQQKVILFVIDASMYKYLLFNVFHPEHGNKLIKSQNFLHFSDKNEK